MPDNPHPPHDHEADPASSSTPIATSSAAGPASVDDIRKQVETEQALSDALKRVEQLEDEVKRVTQDKVAVTTEKDGSDSTVSQLRTQLSALQSSHHQSSSEVAVLKARLAAMDREKEERQIDINRLEQRSNRNSQELQTLRTLRTEQSQKVATLDTEVTGLRMAAESAKFNEERSVQALASARAEILALSKASTDIEERFGRYRAEMQSQVSTLQQEKDSYLSQLTSAQSSLQALQRTYASQSTRLAEAHANIATLTSAAASKKAASFNEISRLIDENKVLEKRADEARHTILEREAELERLADAQSEDIRAWEDKVRKEERARRDAEKRANDYKIVVDRLTTAHGEGSDLSPAAALAIGQKDGGRSYTSFFTEYTLQENKLREAEEEVVRLTALLDEISADIREKKPLLDEQAAEHALAIDRANALAQEMAIALAARDRSQAEAKVAEAELERSAHAVEELQSMAGDLGRQVQVLLRQVAVMNDPSLANTPIDGDGTVDDDIISEHLVEFRSIRSLQEQNVKLLRLSRGLIDKLDKQEIWKATSDVDDEQIGVTMDQAETTITKLHAQLLDAHKKISEVVRERDTFSKLLAKGEGLRAPPSGPNGLGDDRSGADVVERLREEYEASRVKVELEVEEIKRALRAKEGEVGQADIARARAEAQVTLLQEQHRMLADASSLEKTEHSNLEKEYRQVQAAIAHANNERRVAIEQAASKQAEADRYKNEAVALKAERDLWKSREARLETDLKSTLASQAKVQHLLDSLTNVGTETDKSRSEEKKNLERQVLDLQQEANGLRQQLATAKDATVTAEKKAADFETRLASVTAPLITARKEAESLAASRSTELASLRADMDKAAVESRKRLEIGLKHQNRAKDLGASIAEKDRAISEKDAKIQATEKEIEDAKTRIVDLEKKISEIEKGSSHKDATISRLSSELATAKRSSASSQGNGTLAETALKAEKAEKEALQSKLEQVEKDLAAAKASQPLMDSSGESIAGAENANNNADNKALTELKAKFDHLQSEKESWDTKYDQDVAKVNRSNAALNKRRKELEEQVALLRQQLADLQASSAPISSDVPATVPPTDTTDQVRVDEAVRKAVEAKTEELNAEHQSAVEALKSAHASSVPATIVAPSEQIVASDTNESASGQAEINAKVKAAVEQKEAEIVELNKEIADLKGKIKTLEIRNKTDNFARKTLEKQKMDLEARIKTLEGDGASLTATAPAVAASGSTAATSASPGATVVSTLTQSTPVGPGGSAARQAPSTSAVQPAQSKASATSATRGGVGVRGAGAAGRGARGRGAARGARGGGVLANVNSLMQGNAKAAPPASTSTAGQKRAAPEEGEVVESAPAAGAVAGQRNLKRPKKDEGAKDAESGLSSGALTAPAQTGSANGTAEADDPVED